MAGVDLGARPIVYLDYNSAENDHEKVRLFLTDTKNFFASLVDNYQDYSETIDEDEYRRLAEFVTYVNRDIGRLLATLMDFWKRDQERLASKGLTGDALASKLDAVKRARDEFLVASYLVRNNTAIVSGSIADIGTTDSKNNEMPDGPYHAETGTFDWFRKVFRREKKTSAKKWFDRLEILLDSLLSELPGGNFLGEAKEYIKKILGF